ncbi:MAG TPA: secretin N-terminal domain-containing protein [Opitutaceae bacterium]|nr:secretin N-terminal domain-containing protein [Opitutaceae bacterium]
MRNRLQLLTATLTLLALPICAYAQAKPAPAATTTTTTTTTAPAADADFSVKDTNAAGVKSAPGKDTLTVDFADEEIRSILRDVAELFDLNMVIPDTLQGKTTVKLHDVTWHQILQVVLTPVGYTFIEDGNIIKVVSNESVNQEPVSTEIFVINYAKAADIQPTLATLVESAAGGKIVIDARTNSLVITERPSRMKRIRPVIEQLDRPTDQVMIESKFVEIANNDIKNIGVNWSSLSGYNVTATPGAGGLYTYSNTYGTGTTGSNTANGGTSGNTTTNGATTLTSGSNANNTTTTAAGVTTNNGTTTTSSGISGNNGNALTNTISQATNAATSIATSGAASNAISAVFSADQFRLVLSALQQLNSAKIVSNPTIVTLNNSEASINVGQQYPIPNYQFNQQTGTFEVAGFNYKDIGIILKVTPQVNARGFIKLTLAPEVSQNQGTTSFGGASGASIPIIGTRKAITQVSLKDGYTMGIGGLISTNFNTGTNKIPILGDIPIIGYLFKQDSKNNTVDNLVIFITAKTISAEGAPVEQIFNSEEVRAFHMKRSDLPGYRDGSDPFIDESPAPKKLKGMD